MNIAIIGAGAAGFFAAITAKENHPKASVVIFEKSKKVLTKVKISGGGRCNLSHETDSIKELALAYPRGERQLRKVFGTFSNKDAMQWFENRGVALTTQADACVFPVSQDSQTIIDCFLHETNKLNIAVQTEMPVKTITVIDEKLQLSFANSKTELYDKVIVATGGSPKRKGLDWLSNLGHAIVNPVPSLFTFNMPEESIRELMGIVVENAMLSIQGTKLKSKGALLLTHWGMSGPVVLKLSAFGARLLNEKDYKFGIQVNWVNETNQDVVRNGIQNIIQTHPNKKLISIKPFSLPTRLWKFLIEKMAFSSDKKWNELGKKGTNLIVSSLTNDLYTADGKTTFKEEFVTAGGVSLNDVNFKTMQSKVIENLYFAGEVLDIDGITGGYNLQAAWSTGYLAGLLN